MFPDYLSAFGFEEPETEEDLSDFCHRAVQKGYMTQVPETDLKLSRWQVGDDIQIWMYVNPGNEVESMIPFFLPAGNHPVRWDTHLPSETDRGRDQVVGWLIHRSDRIEGTGVADLPGGGAITANSGEATADEETAYRFVFLCIDAPLYPDTFAGDGEDEFQLIATARKPNLYGDREVFREEQSSWSAGLEISPRCFIPSGMLNLNAGTQKEETAYDPYAYVTGIVRNCHVRRNADTEGAYYHMNVETHGLMLDVVLDPDRVPAVPEEEQVIEGHFLILGNYHERPSLKF